MADPRMNTSFSHSDPHDPPPPRSAPAAPMVPTGINPDPGASSSAASVPKKRQKRRKQPKKYAHAPNFRAASLPPAH